MRFAAVASGLRWLRLAAIRYEKPEHARSEVGEVDERQLSVRAFGDGIKIANKREQHGDARRCGQQARNRAGDAVISEVARQCERSKRVGDDETVSRERAEPAINVEPARAARRENGRGRNRRNSRHQDRGTRGLETRMRFSQATVRQSVVRHQQQHSGSSRNAGQRAREQTDDGADIDEHGKRRRASDASQNAHRRLAFTEILTNHTETEHLGVRTNDEEYAGQNGTLNDGARNRGERVARFGAERSGALEADETEQREDEAETQATAGNTAEVKLDSIQVRSVAKQYERDENDDQGYRDGFDPQHEPRRNFHVAPRDGHRDRGDDDGEHSGGGDVSAGVVQKQIGIVIEAADYA